MASRFLAASMGIAIASWCMGCGDTYCQSGPKYGTTCHSLTDVRNQQNGGRPPLSSEPAAWFTQPPPPAKFGAGSVSPAPLPAPAYPAATAPSFPIRPWAPDAGLMLSSADAGPQ